MNPRDPLRSLLAGAGCTVCGGNVPASGIRLLAERDDLAFVEINCPACSSTCLGIVTGASVDLPSSGRLDVAPFGEFGPGDEARLAGGRPIDERDVLAVRDFLARFDGDVETLVGGDRLR